MLDNLIVATIVCSHLANIYLAISVTSRALFIEANQTIRIFFVQPFRHEFLFQKRAHVDYMLRV